MQSSAIRQLREQPIYEENTCDHSPEKALKLKNCLQGYIPVPLHVGLANRNGQIFGMIDAIPFKKLDNKRVA